VPADFIRKCSVLFNSLSWTRFALSLLLHRALETFGTGNGEQGMRLLQPPSRPLSHRGSCRAAQAAAHQGPRQRRGVRQNQLIGYAVVA